MELANIVRFMLLFGLCLCLCPMISCNSIFIFIDFITFFFCHSDPRFLLGVVIYIGGFVMNRWSDWKLRSLRENRKPEGRVAWVLYTLWDKGVKEI